MRIVLTASYARISSHHLFCHMKTKARRLTAEFWGCELESEGKSHDQRSRAPCFPHVIPGLISNSEYDGPTFVSTTTHYPLELLMNVI
jgi:hypothetical protein